MTMSDLDAVLMLTNVYSPLTITINDNHNDTDHNTVKDLQLSWCRGDDDEHNDDNENDSENGDDNQDNDYDDNPPVELQALWNLKHLKQLTLERFPHVSMTVVPNCKNCTNDGSNSNNNSNSNSTTTTMTPSISIGSLSKTLTHLLLTDCCRDGFQLPPDIGMLVKLTSLNMTTCVLERFPPEIGNLASLQNLFLDDLNRLRSLPPEIENLKNLKSLTINRCESLVDIPKEIGNIDNLSRLQITGCEQLDQLPFEMKNLGTSLQTLDINRNETLQPTGFTFDLSDFTKLRSLLIQCRGLLEGGLDSLMLQSLPPSLEKLALYDFNHTDLSILIKEPTITATIKAGKISSSSSKSSSLLSLLPQGIRKLEIFGYRREILIDETNQNVVRALLQTYPQLSIKVDRHDITIINLFEEPQPPRFLTNESLYLMCLNMCGRVLLHGFSNNNTKSSLKTATTTTTTTTTLSATPITQKKQPLPLSMWPIVLEQVKKRIGRMENEKSEQTMTATVIFSLLQGPALMERSAEHFSVNKSERGIIFPTTTTTTTTTAMETTTSTSLEVSKNLKRPFPCSTDNNE